jgi:hypothetical protein
MKSSRTSSGSRTLSSHPGDAAGAWGAFDEASVGSASSRPIRLDPEEGGTVSESPPEQDIYENRRRSGGNSMYEENRVTGWFGWILFAGVMMIMLGSFNAIEGFIALLNGNWLAKSTTLPINFDYQTWGWTWIIFGSLVAIAGLGVLAGQLWARIVGVIFAGLNAIAQLLFIPAYPFWALTVIVVDVLVIWALTVHGGELRE